jgi:hypothetical protein
LLESQMLMGPVPSAELSPPPPPAEHPVAMRAVAPIKAIARSFFMVSSLTLRVVTLRVVTLRVVTLR